MIGPTTTTEEDLILSFVLNPANRAKITAAHVEECFSIDALRTTEESPYLTTRAILPIVNPSSIDDCEPVGNNVELFTYDEAPLLLDQTVIVLQNNQTLTAEYGISSVALSKRLPIIIRKARSPAAPRPACRIRFRQQSRSTAPTSEACASNFIKEGPQ